MVHYRAYGSLDGRYPPTCRAAVVAEVPDLLTEQPNSGPEGYIKAVHITVLNPKGTFHDFDVRYDDSEQPDGGTWHWPLDCPDGL